MNGGSSSQSRILGNGNSSRSKRSATLQTTSTARNGELSYTSVAGSHSEAQDTNPDGEPAKLNIEIRTDNETPSWGVNVRSSSQSRILGNGNSSRSKRSATLQTTSTARTGELSYTNVAGSRSEEQDTNPDGEPAMLNIEIRTGDETRSWKLDRDLITTASVGLGQLIASNQSLVVLTPKTAEEAEALVQAIRILSRIHLNHYIFTLGTLLELIKVVWNYKFQIYELDWYMEDLRKLAEPVKKGFWHRSTGPSISPRAPRLSINHNRIFGSICSEACAWTFLATLFQWSEVFKEASRNAILDNECGRPTDGPGHCCLPDTLKEAVKAARGEARTALSAFGNRLTTGDELEWSTALCEVTLELRCRLAAEGFGLFDERERERSPARLLETLRKVLHPETKFVSAHKYSEQPLDAQAISSPQSIFATPNPSARRGSVKSKQSAQLVPFNEGGMGRGGRIAMDGDALLAKYGRLSRIFTNWNTKGAVGHSPANRKEFDKVFDKFGDDFNELKAGLPRLYVDDYKDMWKEHLSSDI